MKRSVQVLGKVYDFRTTRAAAALYLRQWRSMRLRIIFTQQPNGRRAYFCPLDDTTIVVLESGS